MSFARSAITPLSTRQGRPATPLILARRSRRLPSELRQDRVRHGLQGVYVLHLQPLQHYSLHTGLGEMSEPLDDLARRPGEDGSSEVIPKLPFELAVYVGLRATEDNAGHQGSAYLFGRPPRLAHQFVEPGVEIHKGLHLQEDGAPLVRIYGPETGEGRGGAVALNFLDAHGRVVDVRVVERRARAANISLRTGCFCNPGAGEAAFGIRSEAL